MENNFPNDQFETNSYCEHVDGRVGLLDTESVFLSLVISSSEHELGPWKHRSHMQEMEACAGGQDALLCSHQSPSYHSPPTLSFSLKRFVEGEVGHSLTSLVGICPAL